MESLESNVIQFRGTPGTIRSPNVGYDICLLGVQHSANSMPKDLKTSFQLSYKHDLSHHETPRSCIPSLADPRLWAVQSVHCRYPREQVTTTFTPGNIIRTSRCISVNGPINALSLCHPPLSSVISTCLIFGNRARRVSEGVAKICLPLENRTTAYVRISSEVRACSCSGVRRLRKLMKPAGTTSEKVLVS